MLGQESMHAADTQAHEIVNGRSDVPSAGNGAA